MSLISGNPRGLLSLLRSQNFGEAPKDLLGSIAPTMDLREFFEFDQVLTGFGQFTPALGFPAQDALAGAAVSLTVPPSEFWIVHNATIQAGPAAGAGFRAQVINFYPPGQIQALTDMSAAFVNPQFGFIGTKPGHRYIALPGSRMGINFDTITGVPGAMSLFLRWTPVRV